MTDRHLNAAWAAAHENTPEGWYVGQPMEHPERAEWSQYAFDPSETPIVGKRSREWTAVGQTELRCVREMARCLGELREGRWPEQSYAGPTQRRCGGRCTRRRSLMPDPARKKPTVATAGESA